MITLKQFTGQNITPTDDATLYELFSSSQAGIIYGCNVTSLGANQLQVSAGRGMILGRSFVVEQETILADLASSGNMKGRLSIKIDLGNAETPISFETQVGSTLPDPTQEEINRGGAVYEMPLAEYNVDAIQVSSLKNVAPQIIIASPIMLDVGNYSGNGQATREIELGYRPYFVFVYAQNYPFTQTITSSGTTWIYAASAVDSNINGSKGIAITDNGFEVSQTSSTSPMDGLKMHLNAGSNYYGYLAVRK